MSMDASLTDARRRILQAIADAERVDSDAATWAVAAGLAVQAEDGDIDLTPRGRNVLQAHPPR
ncbi:hypothetical protein C1922_11920 [Stenotrophomonas sp. ZAC14D2_NAIMI4_7]|uniref:hypothetical protein n=1 Tax=Stenotrophomonas sp. ZAC14D2_NAIMI4_7 TaxID=2072405 RepID=UPI000D53C6D8|nr:hypothetical protein [Stenotrophomonas sp. ZAC14D2_NAIMI4_7]AWH17956.1 hypothetical protein C1922_11920 [Stenotrophomonas sp. ZAC14D2_NAIMI4_7]